MEENNTCVYRRGTGKDVSSLAALGLASYGQHRSVLSDEAWLKMSGTVGDPGTYSALLKIATCFVCEKGNRVIGMAFLIPSGNPVAFFEAEWAYIRLVGVHPQFESLGIGRKLTRMCIELAKASGEKLLVLHTSEFQNAARHIYESMGFEKMKTLEPIYNKKYWLYGLKLEKKESISYRKAGPRDINTLVQLRIDFAVALTGNHSLPATEELRAQLTNYFKKTLADRSCIFYLAESGAAAVGVGGLLLRETPGNFKNPSGKWGYLMNMYTVPGFRRKGICSRILEMLVNDASQSGTAAFELHATEEGEKVYRAHGFKIHHEPTYRKYI